MTLEKSLKSKKLLLLIALLSAFPPLSTDMYLPAIPLLQKNWQQPLTMVNMTLVLFFATYCFFLLVYGPLSDRFGRRPPLLVGITVFVVACVLCACADNVYSLIFFRMLQAAGAAAASSVAMAVCKDVYTGNERERILAIIGIIMAVAPMVAPSIGGWIMVYATWPWIFLLQGVVAAIAWVGVWRMPETMKEASATNAREVVGTYFHLLKNKRYVGFTALLSWISVPHFAFIGGSASIYISGYGVSDQTFGYYFALNAASLMTGSIVCTQLRKKMGTNGLILLGFLGIILGGTIMLTHVLPGPWRLALPMSIASFAFGLSRPPSNNLILEQVDRHAGAASSLMVFSYFMIAAFAMWFISLDWADKVSTIGLCAVGISGTALAVWLLFAKKYVQPRQ